MLHHEGEETAKISIFTEWKLALTVKTILNWIGIDLGTTHSSAAYSIKGITDRISGVKIETISIDLENGRSSIPSVVRIQPNGLPPKVGSSALRA